MMARENDDEGVEDDRGGERRRVRFHFLSLIMQCIPLPFLNFKVIFERGRMTQREEEGGRMALCETASEKERKNENEKGRKS